MPDRWPVQPDNDAAAVPARRAFPAPGWPADRAGPRSGPAAQAGWPPGQSWWPRGQPEGGGPASAPESAADQPDWLFTDTGTPPIPADRSPFPQADGAPPGVGGRFAAEWRPSGASSGRNSLLRERGRTGGGVMVRRAILDRGDEITADDEALPPSQLPDARTTSRAPAHWRGSGGRWLVWVARAVAWAVLLLIGYRGVLAIVEGQGTTSTPAAGPAAATPASQFPVSLADAYALEFGQVYLNFSPATAAARGTQLAAFLPPGSDPQLGWDGAGTQHLVSEQVAGVSVTSSRTAVVTSLARVSGAGLIELDVPVYASGTRMSVSGNPSLFAGPGKAVPPQASQAAGDQATET